MIVPVNISIGTNNRHSGYDLFIRKRGESELLANSSTDIYGEIRPLLGILPIGTDVDEYPDESGDDGFHIDECYSTAAILGKIGSADIDYVAPTWDADNPISIIPGESIVLSISGGLAPYVWEILAGCHGDMTLGDSETGNTESPNTGYCGSVASITDGTANTLTAGNDACGTVTVRVTDACGNTAQGEISAQSDCEGTYWTINTASSTAKFDTYAEAEAEASDGDTMIFCGCEWDAFEPTKWVNIRMRHTNKSYLANSADLTEIAFIKLGMTYNCPETVPDQTVVYEGLVALCTEASADFPPLFLDGNEIEFTGTIKFNRCYFESAGLNGTNGTVIRRLVSGGPNVVFLNSHLGNGMSTNAAGSKIAIAEYCDLSKITLSACTKNSIYRGTEVGNSNSYAEEDIKMRGGISGCYSRDLTIDSRINAWGLYNITRYYSNLSISTDNSGCSGCDSALITCTGGTTAYHRERIQCSSTLGSCVRWWSNPQPASLVAMINIPSSHSFSRVQLRFMHADRDLSPIDYGQYKDVDLGITDQYQEVETGPLDLNYTAYWWWDILIEGESLADQTLNVDNLRFEIDGYGTEADDAEWLL